MKDYYAILGVPATATQPEIKKAFRSLAVRYHPDKNPSEDAKGRFQEINEAYNVIGDADKRTAYDALLANPWTELFSQPAAPPRHRDPAYRRRRPPRPSGPSASFLLMRDYLPYVMWISRISFVITVLFFVDYLLPYRPVDDYIRQMYILRRGYDNPDYFILTGSGRQIEVVGLNPAAFHQSDNIRLDVSRIYGRIMAISNSDATYTHWVAYIYTTLIFFPIALFVNSILAHVFRKKIEFCFNLNVTAFMLLIIVLIFI